MKSYEQVDLNNYVLESDDPGVHKFYQDQNHCCFCGHELKITTVKEAGQSRLHEEGHCPSCNQGIIQKKHSIQ